MSAARHLELYCVRCPSSISVFIGQTTAHVQRQPSAWLCGEDARMGRLSVPHVRRPGGNNSRNSANQRPVFGPPLVKPGSTASRESQEFDGDRLTQAVTELHRGRGGIRDFLHHRIHHTTGCERGRGDALTSCERRGVRGGPVDDGTGSFRWQRGQPGVLCRYGPVGRQEGQCPSPVPCPSKTDNVGIPTPRRSYNERAISAASPPSSASREREAPVCR